MKRFFLIFVSIFAFQVALGQDASVVQQKIVDKAKSNESLVADFVQTRYVSSLAKPIVGNGKLYFLRPNKMRWEQTSPNTFVLVVDGSKGAVKQGGAPATTFDISTNRMFKELATIINGGITGSIFSESKNYTITFKPTKDGAEVQLVPKNKNLSRYIKVVQLSFNSSWLANRIVIVEASGNKTAVDLSSMRSNVLVPLTLFDLQ